MAWRLLDHRADAGFEAEGETLEELFFHGAEAFLFLAAGLTFATFTPLPEEELTISLSGTDGEELAVAWLNELVFLAETRSLLFRPRRIKVSLSPPLLTATGETMTSPQCGQPVKAATYGGLVLRTEPRPLLKMFLDL